MDCRDTEWWLAESLSSGRQGFVPSNYIARVDTVYAEE